MAKIQDGGGNIDRRQSLLKLKIQVKFSVMKSMSSYRDSIDDLQRESKGPVTLVVLDEIRDLLTATMS